MQSSRQRRANRSGGILIDVQSGEPATHQHFTRDRPIAILIHGFTADAQYMQDLGQAFLGAEFTTLAFEYPCFRGIDYAAKALADLLRHQATLLATNRAILIGHSMGGLVARAYVVLEGGANCVSHVVTLGAPHSGTLRDETVLKLFANLGETLSGFNPGGYGIDSQSAMQLMQLDNGVPFIQRLNQAPPPSPLVKFLSVSGGHRSLEFGRNTIKNLIANHWLQRRLKSPNDGLVEESSSCLIKVCPGLGAESCSHENKYIEYPNTNHSYIINNQAVAWLAIEFARDAASLHKSVNSPLMRS